MKYLVKPAIIIFLLDQITKLVVSSNLNTKSIALLPYLDFRLAHNKGAAFGILASAGGWQRWVFIIIALVISIIIFAWSKRLVAKDKWEILAFGLILGGAWGNVVDRIRLGYVVDFIDFYVGTWHWYTFNVADIAICIGATALTIFSLKTIR